MAISGFESASDPKKLVILPCSHFEAYTAGFEQGAGAAVDWFRDLLADCFALKLSMNLYWILFEFNPPAAGGTGPRLKIV